MEKHILKKLIEYSFHEPVVLCSVLEWKGSVPRKDFPLMLVSQTAQTTGTIGGGAMEKNVIQCALDTMNTGSNSLNSFDFTNDDLSNDGGLCGGTVKVSIEPFTPEIQSFFKSLSPQAQVMSWLTTYDTSNDTITREHVFPDSHQSNLPIQQRVQSGKSHSSWSNNKLQLFRLIKPKPTLHIFGGGHVGKAVGELAHYIELDITIHDDRASFVSKERFPDAIHRSSDDVTAYMEAFDPSPFDIALIATRGHHHDFEILNWLLNSELQWIGLVSSQRKWKLLSKGLLEKGFLKQDLERVYAPVGLDIKAQTVPEIGISIIGGIISYLHST